MKIFKTLVSGAGAIGLISSALAVDWSSVSGEYTVPADVTNEVATAEEFMHVTNRITKVIFGNENSTLRFAVPYFPTNLVFQGPGTVLMTEKVFLTDETTLRRTLGNGDSDRFVKFVFSKGVDSDDGVTKRTLNYSPDGSGFQNATVSFDGLVTNVNLSGNARIDIGIDADVELNNAIGYGSRIGVVRQRGGKARVTSAYIGQHQPSQVAYLLDDGLLEIKNSENRWYAYSDYLHFRQMGGIFINTSWNRPHSQNGAGTLPADFIYGGTANAEAPFSNGQSKMFIGPMNVAVMDNACVNAGNLVANSDGGDKHRHIVALNGGVLTMNTLITGKNVYYAFNGGALRTTERGACAFGNTVQNDNPAWVRIYENGGCIFNDCDTASDNQYLYLPHLREPAGNVLWSIPIPEGHELHGKVWQTPPAVVITDSTGNGSNAVAVVDYDFDSGKVTNITVVCRGEGYSDGDGSVTANLAYKGGSPLLSEPLVCQVGPCNGGDVVLAGGKTIRVYGSTNTYHGATIVDMDRTREYDHLNVATDEYHHSVFIEISKSPRFDSTNVVVRSGCLWRSWANGTVALTNFFPECKRVEFYGGHFSGWTDSFKDVVVGGETWFVNYKLNAYKSKLTVPADGTLTIDNLCMTNGVTPKLKYGELVFADGARVVLKDWSILEKGRKVVALDLSGMDNVSGTPSPVDSPEGRLTWNAEEKKFYARRFFDGMIIVFR